MARELVTHIAVLVDPKSNKYEEKEVGVLLKNVVGYRKDSLKYLRGMKSSTDEEKKNIKFSFTNGANKEVFKLIADTNIKESSINLITSGAVYNAVNDMKNYVDEGGSGVKNIPSSDKKIYLSGTDTIDENVSHQYFDSSVYLGEEPGSLYATTFHGEFKGNADSATKLETERSFSIEGAVKAEAKTFDGTSNVVLEATEVDASKVKGTLPLEVFPPRALETIVYFDDSEDLEKEDTDPTRALFKLTTDDVQNGDTAKGRDSGRMFLVVDDTKLNSLDGYEEYSAGLATAATKLEKPVNINGVPFDGSNDITILAKPEATQLIDEDLDNVIKVGEYYALGNNTCTNKPNECTSNFGLKVTNIGSGANETIMQTAYWNNKVAFRIVGITQWESLYTSNNKPTLEDIGIESLDEKLSIINNKFGVVYGFHINGNESDPFESVTYIADSEGMTPVHMDFENNIFDYGTWEDAFFMPKPCMVKYDGTLDYYLDPNDYTKKIDGTASDINNINYEGNAMIEWGGGGKIWYKIVPDDGDNSSATIFFSNAQMDSDYVDWSFHNYKGENIDKFYTPIYDGSTDGTRLRSISGQEVLRSKTTEEEITLAKANNVYNNNIWFTEVLSDIQMINLLLVLIGKSLDTQTVFGYGNIASGTGGESKIINTGTMDKKGMFWGSQDNSFGVKVFGMENWWGNQWRRFAGSILDTEGHHKVKYTYYMEDGSTIEGFNTTGEGYIEINDSVPNVNNYISKMKFTKDGMSPIKADGSNNSFYCDWLYAAGNSVVSNSWHGHGGDTSFGALSLSFRNPNTTAFYVGSTISCKPSINSNTKENNIATLENYGRVKLSNASNITDSTGVALPASEKNPNVSGSLANQISQLNADLDNRTYQFKNGDTILKWAVNAKLPSTANIAQNSHPEDAPIQAEMNLIVIGKVDRRTVIAHKYLGNRLFIRSIFRDTYRGEWYEIGSDSGGGHVVSSTAPSNTNLLWVDTGNGGILKYYNGSAWTPIASTWG